MMNSILGQFGMYGRLGESVRREEGLVYLHRLALRGRAWPRAVEHLCRHESEDDRSRGGHRTQGSAAHPRPQSKAQGTRRCAVILHGQLVSQMETNEGIAGQIMNMLRYERGLDWMLNYEQRLRSITVNDVQRAAQTWLDPQNFVLATAGA